MSSSSESFNDVRRTIWVGMVGEIWNHRNNIILNRGVADASEVCALMQVKVWTWVSTKSRYAPFSFFSWFLVPLECMSLVA